MTLSGSSSVYSSVSFKYFNKGNLLFHRIRFKMGSSAHSHGEKHGITLSTAGFGEQYIMENVWHIVNSVHRKLLQQAHNLPAAALKGAIPQEAVDVPSTGSGKDLLAASIHQRNVPPACISPHPKGTPPKESNTADNDSTLSGIMRKRAFVLVLPGLVLLLLLEAFSCATARDGKKRAPWKTLTKWSVAESIHCRSTNLLAMDFGPPAEYFNLLIKDNFDLPTKYSLAG